MPSNLLIGRKEAGEKERERGIRLEEEREMESLEGEGKREEKWVRSTVKNAVVG